MYSMGHCQANVAVRAGLERELVFVEAEVEIVVVVKIAIIVKAAIIVKIVVEAMKSLAIVVEDSLERWKHYD